MVLNSVYETQTTPITPPPLALESQPPQSQPAMKSSFIFSATKSQSQPINKNYSGYSNFRWSLNHPHSNPNRLGTILENQNLPLAPLQFQQSPQHKFGDWGLRLGSTSFTLGDSGLNPIHHFSSSGSSLNPGLRFGPNQTENNNNSPGLGFSDLGMVMAKEGGIEEPVKLVEVSKKKVEEKGKSRVFNSVCLSERNKGSDYATDKGEDAKADEGDNTGGEVGISYDDEELPNLVKNWNIKEDVEAKKTWNLRPRKAIPKPAPPSGGGSRNGEREGQAIRAKTRQPTPTRPRDAAEVAAGGPLRMPMFSISLTKEEIEEDFIKMTGKKPPKKNKRRPKNVQKKMDACFPAVWFSDMTPEMYKVPDPPLKG